MTLSRTFFNPQLLFILFALKFCTVRYSISEQDCCQQICLNVFLYQDSRWNY